MLFWEWERKKKSGSRSIYIWVLFSECTKLESLKAVVQKWILQMWEASRHCWKDIMTRAVKTKLKPIQYSTTLSVQNATHSINNEIPLESCFLPVFLSSKFKRHYSFSSIRRKTAFLPLCKPPHVTATSTVSSTNTQVRHTTEKG